MSIKRFPVITAVALVAAVAWAAPAFACVRSIPPQLDELATGTWEGHAVAGVYEQNHIESAPNLGVRAERTVSVVTRYWGTPPANTGRVMHGDATILGESSCGNESGYEGMIGYGWVPEGSTTDSRGLPWVNLGEPETWQTTGTLSADQEQMLEAAFGPPVVLGVSATTRAAALVQLWWLPGLVAMSIATLIAAPLLWRRRSRRKGAPLASLTSR